MPAAVPYHAAALYPFPQFLTILDSAFGDDTQRVDFTIKL